MRRLARGDEDRGAVAVIVALLMVVLLGCAAISIDVGANYVVKRQLQNGADAAALAVAQDTQCKTSGSAAATASYFIKENVNTGYSAGTAVVDTAKQTVTATAYATDENGARGRPNFFAGVLGHPKTEITAKAKVKCTSASTMEASPALTFHECQYLAAGGKRVLIQVDNKAPQCKLPDGKAAPGAFGWLTQTGSTACSAKIEPLGPGQGKAYNDPGNNLPGSCKSLFTTACNAIKANNPPVFKFPVYNAVAGNGANAWFTIVGFAAFRLEGFYFSSFSCNNTISPSCKGSCRGIIGTFQGYAPLGSQGTEITLVE